MKKLLTYTLIILALTLQTAQAQTSCRDCPCFARLGDSLAEAGDFAGAIRQYNACKACEPDSTQGMNRRIEALFTRIDKLRMEAEEAEKQIRDEELKAARNLARAVEAEKEANTQEDSAKVNADRARREKARSDSLAKVSAALRDTAVVRADRAEKDRLRTEEILRKLSKAFGKLTDIYCKQANDYILSLRYDLALARAAEASALGERSREEQMKGLYLELAYYYNEVGSADTAALMTDSLLVWADTSRVYPATPTLARDSLRSFLTAIDSAGFERLERRYYPIMVPVPGGTFRMGSEKINKDYVKDWQSNGFSRRQAEDILKRELPAHDVTLNDFKMAETETTWWQYALYCRASGIELPSSPGWGIQGNHPVVNVSWVDAQGYIQWLNTRSEGKYNLPTEAEWEYAARGGKTGAKYNFIYAGSNTLEEVGWYTENTNDTGTRPVGGKKPNQLDLYDMSGNVWEWCADRYGDYPKEVQVNPTGAVRGVRHVLRGGRWRSSAVNCRVAYRSYDWPSFRSYDVGFRLVLQL